MIVLLTSFVLRNLKLLLFIFDTKGDKLKDFLSNTVVLDVFGDPILCDGDWKDPGNSNQFLSAVTSVHAARAQNGPYKTPCMICTEGME
jgi:hypothetical protein